MGFMLLCGLLIWLREPEIKSFGEALEAFLEKAERLPELSREELEALARQAKHWR